MYWNIFMSETTMETTGHADRNALASIGTPLDLRRSPVVWTIKEKEKNQQYVPIPGNVLWKDVLKDQSMIGSL